MSETVLVTGGAGYIGSHTCKALKAAGITPVTFDNMVYGHEWAVKFGPLVKGDILDGAKLDEVFEEYSPKAVMHFAAYAYVGESVTNPEKYYHNNVAGTLSLLSAMRRHNVKNIVFSSTCATYGIPKQMPITEDLPQAPINPYGWSKLMMEQIFRDFEHAYGMRHAILRYFNAAGADPDGEIGEDHNPETHLIPLVIAAAQGRIPHVSIFGTDYPTEDGTCIRDYIHVTDLARAHVLALNHIRAKDESLIVNLGTGKGTSVREIVDAVEEVSGLKVPVVEGPRRAGDPPALYADVSKAKKLLGFQAEFMDPRDTVRHSFAWHDAHHGRG